MKEPEWNDRRVTEERLTDDRESSMESGRKELVCMGKNKLKKITASLLSVALMCTATASTIVYATEQSGGTEQTSNDTNTVDTSDWFATAEQLKNYDTDNTTGNTKPAKKVYFGQNGSSVPQEWWIVGQDPVGGGMVLFAASPLQKNVLFNTADTYPSPSSDLEMDFDSNWQCTYSENPTKVYVNHYGGSNLRLNVLKKLEKDSNYFSNAEQGLMKTTTITTYDTKKDATYTTEDVLYTGYGDYPEGDDVYSVRYFTAGTNSAHTLNKGLRIDADYWGEKNLFWLRTPKPIPEKLSNPDEKSYTVLIARYGNNSSGGPYVDSVPTDFMSGEGVIHVAPAFQLDTSSVLFASAAQVATTEGVLSINSEIFTLRYLDETIGSANINPEKNKVTVKNAGADSYLIVQNSTGAYAKSVGSNDTVDINASDITINNSQLTSFADCKVWLEKTNTNDNITVATMAVDMVPAPAPTVEQSTTVPPTASTITVKELSNTDTYGTASYSINGTDWQDSNTFNNLKANTDYIIHAKYKGMGTWLESEEGTAVITTASPKYTITIPQKATAGGVTENIEVDKTDPTNRPFDLGYGGQVNVKVKRGEKVSTQGVLTLTRQKDTSSTTLTSAMCVNDNPFTNITENVAVFKTKDDPAVPISFGKPTLETGSIIPAGTYSGTVTFLIEYSQP